MKKTLKIKMAAILLAGVALSGCNNFEEMNVDPNKALTTNPAWLATNILTEVTQSTAQRTTGFKQPYNLSKYLLWTEITAPLQYNDLARASFDNKLTLLRNIEPMISNAKTEADIATYTALAHFVRAWQFFQTSMRVGDIPYSEAAQGDKNLQPKYDTQKDIFKGILSELDEAAKLFAKGNKVGGDIIYGGDADKWQRLSNSFQLYVLINLYKKTSDTDLNVVNKFKEVAARPLMRDYDDNFALKFNGSKSYCYPWSKAVDANEYVGQTMLSTYYIDMLKANGDQRLFYVAEPSKRLVDAGADASTFAAYEGVDPGLAFGDTMTAKNNGAYSDLNDHYVWDAVGEPLGFLCYWDVQFILAEASVRGWITGAADTYYANGIKSSMNFYVKYVDPKYTHGMDMTEAYINAYPSEVALAGTMEQKVEQIICQKYLAGFFHNEYLSWYEFRRTGYPRFVVNPTSNLNSTDNTKFPLRWLYPQNEIDYNTTNVMEAIQRQYGGSDDHMGKMWILQ